MTVGAHTDVGAVEAGGDGGVSGPLERARRELAKFRGSEEAARRSWNVRRLVAIVVCAVGAPFVTNAAVDPPPVDTPADALRAVWTYGWRFLLLANFTALLLVPKDGRLPSWKRIAVAVLVGASYAAGWFDGVTDGEFTGGLAAFGTGASTLAVGVIVVVVALTYALEPWQESRRLRELRDTDPESYALARIDDALESLGAGIPTAPDRLRATLDALEDVAQAIEIGVCRRAGVREPAVEQWLSESTRARAEAIRKLGRALCLPRQDTRELVFGRLEEARTCIAEGRWGDLPEAKVGSGADQRAVVRAGRALRDLLVGALPLAAVATLEREVGLDSSLQTALWTFAVGLAVVTALSLLDPKLADKLSLTKTLREASK